MRIYNEDKTRELSNYEIDLEKGHIVTEKKLIAHHEATEAREAIYTDRHEKLPNGSTQIWKDVVMPAIEAREAYDEYEEIQIYMPYTVEELKSKLRTKREKLLTAFDKWEKAVLRSREQDSESIMAWYQDLLDLKDTVFDNVPERIRYYL